MKQLLQKKGEGIRDDALINDIYQSFLNMDTTTMTGLFYVPVIPGRLDP